MKTNAWLAGLTCGLSLWAAGAAPAAWAVSPGDAIRGEAVYSRCLACHALAYDRTGPRHCGLFGRQAGTVPGFAYSEAMRDSKIVWDEKTLNLFLQNPMKAVPGTSMGYAGIADPQERADLIAYLKKENASADCKGK
ncbi:MAG TPA: cytochrome c family protein [Pusillimonas sp.]